MDNMEFNEAESNTNGLVSEDQQYLDGPTAPGMQEKAALESKPKPRAEDIAALAEIIEIIWSNPGAHAAEEHRLFKLFQQAARNPCKKVMKLITDLISGTMEESTSEIEHKGWCYIEPITNKQTRDWRIAEASRLNAEIEDLIAEIVRLTQDIADLEAAANEIDAAMAKRRATSSGLKQRLALTPRLDGDWAYWGRRKPMNQRTQLPVSGYEVSLQDQAL